MGGSHRRGPVSYAPTATQGNGVAPDALSLSGSTVSVSEFTVNYGGNVVTYSPNGTSVSGLTQTSTTYFIYTQDPNYAGGTPTAYATTTSSAYLNKVSYVLVGSVAMAA